MTARDATAQANVEPRALAHASMQCKIIRVIRAIRGAPRFFRFGAM